MNLVEHRRHPRFHVLSTMARSGRLEARVLNLSRSGMLLESADGLPVGRQLLFEVSDRQHNLEVEAEVRWSLQQSAQAADLPPVHRSGVQFSRILSRQARGVWARLVAQSGETGLPVGHRPPAESGASPVPMLTILAPEDGAVVHDHFVTVIGQLRDRGLGAVVEVNGVRATVSGRRFEAKVGLSRGGNLLTAAIATSGALICRSPAIKVTADPPAEPES